jgi:hypothetical protein
MCVWQREKRERRKNGMASAAVVGSQWGKYGIISESECVRFLSHCWGTPSVTLRCSIFTKEPEFRAWLVEERKMNPERMSKDQNKKEFARFVEDYNTGSPSWSFVIIVIDSKAKHCSYSTERKILQYRGL